MHNSISYFNILFKYINIEGKTDNNEGEAKHTKDRLICICSGWQTNLLKELETVLGPVVEYPQKDFSPKPKVVWLYIQGQSE